MRSDRRGYSSVTDTYHAQHDWSASESLVNTLCDALAAIRGVDARETPLLSEFVDPDALESLFEQRQRSGRPTDAIVFRQSGWAIRIQRDGHIVIWSKET